MLLATELWEHFCCVGVDKVNAECFSMSVMLQKWKGQLHFWLWSSLSQIFHVPVQTSETLHLMQRMFTLKKKKNFSFFFFFGFFPVLLRSCHFEVKKVSVRRRGLGFFFFFLPLPFPVIKSLLDRGWKLWDSLDSFWIRGV